MKLYLNLKNIWKIFILVFILSSCSNIGGIVEIAVKDVVNSPLDTKEIIQSIENNNIASLKKEKIDKINSKIQNIPLVVAQPKYKIGNPYEIKDIWYYPKRDLTYEETGIASWYGEKFHGKLTANGEIFNKDIISAAHKTLPMPSMVRVTNLDNGNVLNVRINDRGPYIHGRIIDLSEKAADLLGFKDVGIARVRVKILVEKSLWLERSAKEGKFPGSEIASYKSLEFPSINSASRPKVAIIKTVTDDKEIIVKNNQNKTNFTEILASSRQGNLRKVTPQETKVWVQIGAFASTLNANKVASKISHIYDSNITTIEHKGRILHRVRLGPTQEIEKADEILMKVFELGYNGSKIIVE